MTITLFGQARRPGLFDDFALGAGVKLVKETKVCSIMMRDAFHTIANRRADSRHSRSLSATPRRASFDDSLRLFIALKSRAYRLLMIRRMLFESPQR